MRVDFQKAIMTEEQRLAALSTDRSVCVIAGAGSGKTSVLVNRILNILGDDWDKISRMLVITFTEKAAGELKNKIRNAMPAMYRHKVDTAMIGTFHSCMASMIRQNAPEIGIDPTFEILNESASSMIYTEAARDAILSTLDSGDEDASILMDEFDFTSMNSMLDELLSFRWHARKVLTDVKSHEDRELRFLKSISKLYFKAESYVDERLGDLNAMDFQGLEIESLKLLEEHRDVLKFYRDRFEHVLVDEFQDTNDLQAEFISKLYHPKHNFLCVVGDPRQSIYRFRGANVECFADVLKLITSTGGIVINLRDNFRSHHKIVEFTNRYQTHFEDFLFDGLKRKGVDIDSSDMASKLNKPCDGPSLVRLCLSTPKKSKVSQMRRLEADTIASFLANDDIFKKYNYGDIVFLFQTLNVSDVYEASLKRFGIPYSVEGGRGLFDKREISDLLSVLKYVADPEDDVAMLSILRSPIVGISDDDLVILAGDDGKHLRDNVLRDGRCHILNELKKMSRYMMPSEIIKNVVRNTGYEVICDEIDSSGSKNANVERFIGLVSLIERSEPSTISNLSNFLVKLRKIGARIGSSSASTNSPKSVRLMTVHAAKGLEFPVVILPDLIRSGRNFGSKWQFSRESGFGLKLTVPGRPVGELAPSSLYQDLVQDENERLFCESKRILYVAMTRPMDILVMPTHVGFDRKKTWHSDVVKILESECEADAIINYASDTINMKTAERVGSNIKFLSSKKISLGNRTEFSVSQLESYYRCPYEYYLKYVLGVPAELLIDKKKSSIPANVLGSIVHDVFQWYDGKFNNLPSLVRRACINNDLRFNDDIFNMVQKFMTSFESIPLSKSILKGDREVPFVWNIYGKRIVGYIDWLMSVDEGVDVIDFKTDRVEKNNIAKRAEQYDLQLLCYSLAVEDAMDVRVDNTSLVFLYTGVEHRKKMTDERRKSARKLIKNIFKFIDNSEFSPTRDHMLCRFCPYRYNKACEYAINSDGKFEDIPESNIEI